MKPHLKAVRAKNLMLGNIIRGMPKFGLSPRMFVVDTVTERADFDTLDILCKDGTIIPAVPDEYFLVESSRRTYEASNH